MNIQMWEAELQMIIVVITNITLLPPSYIAFKKKNAFNFVICIATLITSVMYHIGDVFENHGIVLIINIIFFFLLFT